MMFECSRIVQNIPARARRNGGDGGGDERGENKKALDLQGLF
jgi:hypothetical protein